MRKLTKVLLILLVSVLPLKEALALDCYLGGSGGPVEETKTITPFAIPSNAQVGQKIWESDDIKIPVTCNHNVVGDFEPEDVYAWVNPYPAASDPYYELGVTYEGMDYDATGQPNGVDTHQCLDNDNILIYTPAQIRQMGWENLICSGNPDDIHTSRVFVARLRLFVKIKAIPPMAMSARSAITSLCSSMARAGLTKWPTRKTSNTILTACKTLPCWTAGQRSAYTPKTRRLILVPLAPGIL